MGDNRGTTEEPGNGNRPCSRDEFTSDTIQNPSVLLIQTTSKWDSGPSKLACTIPATDEGKEFHELAIGNLPAIERHRVEEDACNPKGIVVKNMFREPAHPVAEFLWPPEFRGLDPSSPANSNYLDSNPDIQTATNSGHNDSKRSLGNLLYVSGRLGRAAEPHQLRGQKIQESGGLKGNCFVELWILGDGLGVFLYSGQGFRYGKYLGHCKRALKEIEGGLIGGFGGKRIWDPGGERAESLFTVIRCRERREKWAG